MKRVILSLVGYFYFLSDFDEISVIGFLSKKLLYVCQQIFAISDHFEKIGVKGVKNAVSKGKNALFIFLKFPIVF